MIGLGHRSVLQILVERKTRYTHIGRLPAKNAEAVVNSISQTLLNYSKKMRRTITYDNGSENANHMEINKNLGTQSFFCDPMASWQKGSVENTIGLIRRWWPKKTDFQTVSDDEIARTEAWINSLPKKCLGFKTPREALRSVALNG